MSSILTHIPHISTVNPVELSRTRSTSPVHGSRVLTGHHDRFHNEGKELAEKIANQIKGASLNKNTIKLLEQINKDNVLDVLKYYTEYSKKSLAVDIDEEWGLDVKTVRKYVIAPLIEKAQDRGIDYSGFETLTTINDVKELEVIIKNFTRLFDYDVSLNASGCSPITNLYENHVAETEAEIAAYAETVYEEIEPETEFSLDRLKEIYPITDYNYQTTNEDDSEIITITSNDGNQSIIITKNNSETSINRYTLEINTKNGENSETCLQKQYSHNGKMLGFYKRERYSERIITESLSFNEEGNPNFFFNENNRMSRTVRMNNGEIWLLREKDKINNKETEYRLRDGSLTEYNKYTTRDTAEGVQQNFFEYQYQKNKDGSSTIVTGNETSTYGADGKLISKEENGCITTYWPNGLIKSKKDTIANTFEQYNSDGTLVYKMDDKTSTSELAQKIQEDLNKKTLIFSKSVDKDIEPHIMQITPENVFEVLSLYYTTTGKYLDDAIQSSTLNADDKARFIQHINNCKEANNGYTLTYSNESSRIQNEYYTGGDYAIRQENDIIYVKNKTTGRTHTINILELISEMSPEHKRQMIEYLHELPGEVLEDLAIEMTYIHSDYSYNNHLNRANGYYTGEDDEITFVTTARMSTLTHELGHAIDHTNTDWTSDYYTQFQNTFNQEMQRYLAAGNLAFEKSTSDEDKSNTHRTQEDYYNYCTMNNKEMFAECYTLLMLGNCNSKDCILTYFPETLNAAKSMLNSIREFEDNSRH